LHRNPATALTAGIAADLSTVLLFAIALTVALLVPAIGYYALFLMLLTPLVQRLLLRLIGQPGGA
jgi:hypothetical protein